MPLPTGFDELAAVAVGQSVYVLGGDRGFGSAGNAVYVGSRPTFQDEAWAPAAPMRVARKLHAAGVLRGEVYAVGGWDEYLAELADVECYNVHTDSWRDVAPLLRPRTELAVATVGDELYAVTQPELVFSRLLMWEMSNWQMTLLEKRRRRWAVMSSKKGEKERKKEVCKSCRT